MPKSFLSYVIAFISTKGGTGKTTIATTIAILLQQMGYKVLLIDADIKGSESASWWHLNRENNGLSEIDFIDADKTAFKQIRKLCGVKESIDDLANALYHIRNHYDFVIVDTGGYVSDQAQEAVGQADVAIAVADTSSYSVKTTPKVDKIVGRILKQVDYSTKTAGLINKARTQHGSKKHIPIQEALEASDYLKPLSVMGKMREAWEDCAEAGSGITEMDDPKAEEECLELMAEIMGMLTDTKWTAKQVKKMMAKHGEVA